MVSIVLFAALAVVILVDVLCWAGSLYTLDQLIRREYEAHRAAWDSDGRPSGLISFRPPEADYFAGRRAYSRLYYGWLFTTPRWVESDPEARKLLTRTRCMSAAWHLGFVFVMFSTWIYMAASHNI